MAGTEGVAAEANRYDAEMTPEQITEVERLAGMLSMRRVLAYRKEHTASGLKGTVEQYQLNVKKAKAELRDYLENLK